MATETLSLTRTRYKGTSVDTQVANNYIGNVYASGSAEYYRIKLSFTPKKQLNKITFTLKYGAYKNVTAISYRRGFTTGSTVISTTSTSGSSFTWNTSTLSATITATGTWYADTTYHFWIWSPDQAYGYVVLHSYSATGTVVDYAVSYDANGGTGAPGSQTKVYGTALTLSSTKPTKASTTATGHKVTFNANGGTTTKGSATATDTTKYTFSSWNTESDGSGTSYSSGGSYTDNAAATLYAQYTSTTTKGAVTLPTVAECTRPGYDLLGFAASATAATAAYAPGASYTPSAAVTLYAVWKSRGLTYIDNGTSNEAYQVFIEDGSAFAQYAPYVDNGTTWEELS